MLSLILLVITILFPLIMTFIPFSADILSPDKKKLTKAGGFFIFIGICAVIAGVWLGHENGKDVDYLKGGIDSLSKQYGTLNSKYDAHAKSDSLIGLSFDSKMNKSVVTDTQLLKSLLAKPIVSETPKLIVGNMPVEPGGGNPQLLKVKDNYWNFVINLATSTDEMAYDIKDENTCVFEYSNSNPEVGHTIYNTVNHNTTISKGGSTVSYGFIVRRLPDTIYDLITINYSNNNGIPQKPFIRMFVYTSEYLHKPLLEANDRQYTRVMTFLKSKKYQFSPNGPGS